MHMSAVIVMGPNQAEVCSIALRRQSVWASVFVELISYAAYPFILHRIPVSWYNG